MLLEHEQRERDEHGVKNDRMLLWLGDPEMTKVYVSLWNSGSARVGEEIEKSARADIIPHLVEGMFREEPFVVRGRDTTVLPMSFYTAELVRNIVKASPLFNREVIEWADRQVDRTNQETIELRAIMREWWRENERHFKAKNYAAVKPGRELQRQETLPSAPSIQPEPVVSASATSAPPTTSTQSPAETPEPAPPVWPWLTGIAALIAAGYAILRSRKASSKPKS